MSLLLTSPSQQLSLYVTDTLASGQRTIDALLADQHWQDSLNSNALTNEPLVISYSFIDPDVSGFVRAYGSSDVDEPTHAQALSESHRDWVRQALANISRVAHLQFVEVEETVNQTGVIRVGALDHTSSDYAAYAYLPGEYPEAGDVWIDQSGLSAGQDYLQHVFIHELLHAIGLKHPFEEEGTNQTVLTTEDNIIPNTVMSYSAVVGNDQAALSNYPSTPMPFDVAALQWLYGPSVYNESDTVYDLSQSPYTEFYTLWDTGGTDTLDARSLRGGLDLDLRADHWSGLGFQIDASGGRSYGQTLYLYGSTIENVWGSRYADRITANSVANQIDGGAGSDTVIYTKALADYRVDYNPLTATYSWMDRQSPEDTDSLIGVERVQTAGSLTSLSAALDTSSPILVEQNQTVLSDRISVVNPEQDWILTFNEPIQSNSNPNGTNQLLVLADRLDWATQYTLTLQAGELADLNGNANESVTQFTVQTAIQTETGLTDSQIRLEAFYLAYYGRPADPSGLDYWDRTLRSDALGGDEVKMGGFFGNNLQPEFARLYGSALGNQDFIEQVYTNLFGRSVDSAGQQYWQQTYTDFLARGWTDQDIRAQMVIWILDGAVDSQDHPDRTTIDQRVLAAQWLTNALSHGADAEHKSQAYEQMLLEEGLTDTSPHDWLEEVTAQTDEQDLQELVSWQLAQVYQAHQTLGGLYNPLSPDYFSV